MTQCHPHSYSGMMDSIVSGGNWRIVSSINFEECSIRFVQQLLERLTPADMDRITIVAFRLVSQRATPWSALEVIKSDFEEKLVGIAKSRKIKLAARLQEHPAERDAVYNLLFDHQLGGNYKLVVDYSALPRRMGVFMTDMLFRIPYGSRVPPFEQAFAVITPPRVMAHRTSLGPFSVGLSQPIYHATSIRSTRDVGKLSVLIFPGWEGFEAKQTIDEFASNNTDITVAFALDDWSLRNNLREIIANQAALVDGVEDKLSLAYYFSPSDAFRVADDFVDRAIGLARQFPGRSHGLLIAPFGPKWTLLVAAYARQRFLKMIGDLGGAIDHVSDVVSLPTSQYLSFHSHGCGESSCFVLQ
jgi:hypothetical protein